MGVGRTTASFGLILMSTAALSTMCRAQRPGRAALVTQGSVDATTVDEGTVRWLSTAEREPSAPVTAEVAIPGVIKALHVTFRADQDRNQPFLLRVEVDLSQDPTFRERIDRIGMLEARADAQQIGTLLAGNVTSGAGKLSLALTEGDVNIDNLDLLLNDNWIEVPILFKSKQQAKITFEKGPVGQKQITKLIEALKVDRP